MAKLEDRKTTGSSGAYERLFGIKALGALMSKVQGTVIASGSELERMIQNRLRQIEDLDAFLEIEIMQEGVFMATKLQIKRCNTLDSSEAEPDFLIFKRRDDKQSCYVIELKDGHQFDTKKASAERRMLHAFTQQNAHRIHYTVQPYICCFNQDSKKAIVEGLKNKINIGEVLTGREFCNLLELDYDEIVKSRGKDQERNLAYFLRELMKIDAVRERLSKLFNKQE